MGLEIIYILHEQYKIMYCMTTVVPSLRLLTYYCFVEGSEKGAILYDAGTRDVER